MTLTRTLSLLLISMCCMAHTGCQATQNEVTQGDAPHHESVIPLQDTLTAPETLKVTSPDFAQGERLDVSHSFNEFGCVGQNTTPTLTWENVPEGTKSFAVIVHDPDAPTGVGFFHWVLVDLPANTRTIASGDALPQGSLNVHTDYGRSGYGGPCPPKGRTHRYVFSVYALDVESLGIPAQATGALTRFMLNSHTLAYGRLVGTFSR